MGSQGIQQEAGRQAESGAVVSAPPFVVPRDASVSRRVAIEAEIEIHLQRVDLLLGRLDRMDGDCDLEDDDPAGDIMDERGEAPTDDGREMLPTLPLYAVDQVCGPINERAAVTAYHRNLYREDRA